MQTSKGGAGGAGRDVLCPCGSRRPARLCCAGGPVGGAASDRSALAGATGGSAAGGSAARGALAPGLSGPVLPGLAAAPVQLLPVAPRHVTLPPGRARGPAAAPKSLAERQRDAAGYMRQAAGLRASGQLAASIRPLQLAIGATPDAANPYYDLGLTWVRCGRHAEAVGPLLRATQLNPGFADAHFALAGSYSSVGRTADAIACLRRAVALAPGRAAAWHMLGSLLHSMEQFAEARACLARAAAAGRDTVFGRLCKAQLLAEDRNFAEAVKMLRQSLVREPGHYESRVTLAHMLAARGEIAAAIGQFELAAALPDIPISAWAGLVQIKQITDADRDLVGRMEDYLAQDNVAPTGRMTLHFALGKARDDLGDYAGAMRHFDAANRMRKAQCGFDRAGLLAEFDTIKAAYPAEFVAARGGEGLADETPILVLGLPRSGTTLVEQILSSHPEIAGAGEMIYWHTHWAGLRQSGRLVTEDGALQGVARGYLAALRAHGPAAARVVDKSLSNFQFIGMILHALPRARIVHCRRHPVDTCLSIYFTPFEAIRGWVADREDLVFYTRQYQAMMAHWRAALPADRMLEVDYESLVAAPEESARRLIAFAGLPWDAACLRPEDNRRDVRTASIWQVRQPVYGRSVARWKRYAPWLGALATLMPER